MKTAHPVNFHYDPANIIEEAAAHLPPGHTAFMEIDPVVAFLHTSVIERNKQSIRLFPLTPNSTGHGFIEVLDLDEVVLATTPATPGGLMYSLFVRGPIFNTRFTIGYSYPGQSPINWKDRALITCDMLREAADPIETLLDVLEKEPITFMERLEAQCPEPEQREFIKNLLKRRPDNGDEDISHE